MRPFGGYSCFSYGYSLGTIRMLFTRPFGGYSCCSYGFSSYVETKGTCTRHLCRLDTNMVGTDDTPPPRGGSRVTLRRIHCSLHKRNRFVWLLGGLGDFS